LLTARLQCPRQAEGAVDEVAGRRRARVDNPFLWCDNLSNNDPTVLTFMSRAFANTVVRMAFDTSVMWPGGGPRHKPKRSRDAKAGRRLAAD
jgi:hypothetical protein